MDFRAFREKLLTRGAFFRGSAVLAFTTILSYALGLYRDRIFARTFGASRELDAYNAAFTLPDLILNIFVAGALTAAFVPIFSELLNSKDEDNAGQFLNSVLNSSLITVIISGILVFIYAPQLSHMIVPGFSELERKTFIDLTRLLLLSPIIFSISNTLGNIIVVKERFFWYGISAALYNLGTILGTIFLAGRFGIYGAAIGTLAGAGLHLGSRIIGLARLKRKNAAGYSRGYSVKIHLDGHFRRFIRMMLPKVIGQPVEQLTFLGFTVIASTIGIGSITILNFAHNFQSMPINVIGITFAMTMFPVLSRLAAQNNRRSFLLELNFTIRSILLFSVPAALLTIGLRNLLISIFLGGGAFTQAAVNQTGATLGFFALSIPSESLSHLFARGFYALKNSATPVIVSLAGLGIAVAVGYFLSVSMGVSGLAMGFFFGSIVKTGVLWALLHRESHKLAL